MEKKRTWHQMHTDSLNFGQRLADRVAAGMGSWRFIIIQTLFVLVWVCLNIVGFMQHWDAYPFILLNLLFSVQASYAAPVIMMAQNRQADRDREQAQADYQTNVEAKEEIEKLQIQLNKLEVDKLDKIIRMLEEFKEAKK